MQQLVYVSMASAALGTSDLNAVLDASRRRNRKLGVTGLLLHIDRGFLQVLEGPEQSIDDVFASICRDPRHTALRLLVRQQIDRRLFEGWSMGFEKLNPAYARTAAVFAITRDAVENAVAPEKAADIAILLRSFYNVNSGVFAA